MRYTDSLPADARLLHTLRYTLRWGDMDAFDHINNAVYFTLFEQARVDWLHALGVGHGLVLANVSCTFFKPLTYPAVVEVALYAGRQGRSSLDTYYEIREHGQRELCSFGHGTVVWYDHDTDTPTGPPEAVSRQLAALGGEG